MLYDQAQLLSLYSEAYALTDNDMFAQAARDIIKYITGNLMDNETGAFFSAEDADSLPTADAKHKLEGAFCVWTMDELVKHLGPEGAEMFAFAYGVKHEGNVPSNVDIQGELKEKNVLYVAETNPDIAKKYNLTNEEVQAKLEDFKKLLASIRKNRPSPHKDDKVFSCITF